MTEYIEREKAIKDANTVKVPGLPQWNSAVNYTIEKLKSISAADVKPVVRGKWIVKYPLVTCSVCCNTFDIVRLMNFCPNCGADMR